MTLPTLQNSTPQRSSPLTIGALLAAGASRRFGAEDKLLAPYRSQALVTWAAQALVSSGCDSTVAIISSPAVGATLPAGINPLVIPAGEEMSASFKAAIAHAQACKADRLLICLGDMPHVDAALLQTLRARSHSTACTCQGQRLPPILLMAEDFAQAAHLAQGDHGARAFIRTLPPDALVEIAPLISVDMDVPADFDR